MHCGSTHNANRRSEWPLRESHIHSQALLLAMSVLGIYRFLCSGALRLSLRYFNVEIPIQKVKFVFEDVVDEQFAELSKKNY